MILTLLASTHSPANAQDEAHCRGRSHIRRCCRPATSKDARSTGAALLEGLSHAASGGRPTGVETFLATVIYLRTCAHERAGFRATLAS